MDFGLHVCIILEAFWHSFSILFRHLILHAFFSNFIENCRQVAPKDVGVDPPLAPKGRSKNASKTHTRFFIDFTSILVSNCVPDHQQWMCLHSQYTS